MNRLPLSQRSKLEPVSTTVVDRVLFTMPTDRELQFPAMAVLQAYVNGYQQKMQQNDTSLGVAKFVLQYDVEIDVEDWNFFTLAGIQLTQQKQFLSEFDCIIDLSDERIASYAESNKHAAQVCGIMAGVGTSPYPRMSKLRPKIHGYRWVYFDRDEYLASMLAPLGFSGITEEELYAVKDDELTGIIGYAGRETFYALAKGLAAVELLPVGRSRRFMSKWASAGYRLVVPEDGDVQQQIYRALASIERELAYVRSQLTKQTTV